MADGVTQAWAQWESNFIGQVARLRKARGMNQTDLAKVLQDRFGLRFHQQTVQRIESGARPVRLDEAHLIAQVFGVTLESMTASAAPSEAELRYAVDRVRREADDYRYAASESIGELTVYIESLWVDLSDRELGKTSDDLDPATRWGMAFFLRALEVLETAVQAERLAALLSGTPIDEAPTAPAVIVDTRAWQRRYGDLLPLEPEESKALYDSFSPEPAGG